MLNIFSLKGNVYIVYAVGRGLNKTAKQPTALDVGSYNR